MEILRDGLVSFLSSGLLDATWWQILLYVLVTTHITITSVTIFLHRAQAHRALTLHPVVEHFFRFWLWVGTGMVTKEFVAIHRKHHAKCETVDDPHSPWVYGIKKLLLEGVELYRAAAKTMPVRLYIPGNGSVPRVAQTELEHYGAGTPDDWLERNVYAVLWWQGVGAMLILDIMLFGAIGAMVWAVQMVWIPWWATGVINGLGHYVGYRNFSPEPDDKSTNISPWGILIGGEELHNNHHTYPTSAKFSVKPWEFDIGWAYIRVMEAFGLAKVKKIYPIPELVPDKKECDGTTVDAVIALRHQLLAELNRSVRREREDWWARVEVREFRDRLQYLWQREDIKKGEFVEALKNWCHSAYLSGVPVLQKLAQQLPKYRLKSR